MISLEGSVAWVTGAGSGLGRVASRALRDAGATVVLTSRGTEAIEAVARELEDRGTPADTRAGSVADSDFVRSTVDWIADRHGRLDVLVNMAGINPVVRASVDLSDDDWRDVIDVNLSGTFFCCREAGRVMLAQGGGSIVNVSSAHGSTAAVRMAAYGAGKGGVENLTRSLAVEWATSGVRVNCVAPGYFRTAMTDAYLNSPYGDAVRASTPMHRFGEPEELGGVVVFLASGQSSFMTGAIVTVDGGWTAQ